MLPPVLHPLYLRTKTSSTLLPPTRRQAQLRMVYKYADIPQFSYQNVQSQYQTYDYETQTFKFYPITYSATDLTEGQNQDNKEPTTDPEKDPASDETPAAEPSSDDSPAAEPAGK